MITHTHTHTHIISQVRIYRRLESTSNRFFVVVGVNSRVERCSVEWASGS